MDFLVSVLISMVFAAPANKDARTFYPKSAKEGSRTPKDSVEFSKDSSESTPGSNCRITETADGTKTQSCSATFYGNANKGVVNPPKTEWFGADPNSSSYAKGHYEYLRRHQQGR